MEKKEIVYGRNPVLEHINAASSGIGLELYISNGAHGKIINRIISAAKKKAIKVSYMEKSFFQDSQCAPSSVHQGVILKIPHTHKKSDKNSILKSAVEKKGLLLLLDRLTDPHNVGSIIRTAEALGGSGIIITRSNSPGINPTVAKSSAGATAHMDIITISNISSFLKSAKDCGFWIIGTSEHGDKDLSRLRDMRPAIVVIGNEGSGMRQIVEEKCDFIVGIEMKGKIRSLNASVAAGIILHEMLKD